MARRSSLLLLQIFCTSRLSFMALSWQKTSTPHAVRFQQLLQGSERRQRLRLKSLRFELQRGAVGVVLRPDFQRLSKSFQRAFTTFVFFFLFFFQSLFKFISFTFSRSEAFVEGNRLRQMLRGVKAIASSEPVASWRVLQELGNWNEVQHDFNMFLI